MSEPKTREELEQTIWFKSGAEAKRNKKKLVDVVQCLRFGCWQYDAVVAGYDSAPSKQKGHNARVQAAGEGFISPVAPGMTG